MSKEKSVAGQVLGNYLVEKLSGRLRVAILELACSFLTIFRFERNIM